MEVPGIPSITNFAESLNVSEIFYEIRLSRELDGTQMRNPHSALLLHLISRYGRVTSTFTHYETMPLHTATEMCSRLWQLALVRVNLRSLLLVILICCLVNYIYVHEAITETWPPSEYDASQKTTKPTEHRDAPPLPPSVHAVTEKHRFRQLNVKDFPYRCGIVLFYHIPCTGLYTNFYTLTNFALPGN